MGVYTSQEFMPANIPGHDGKGLTVLYTGGDSDSSFYVDLSCDPEAGLGTPELASKTGDSMYHFTWKTAAACPRLGMGTLAT